MSKVAVITGGASGFGLALGRECAAKGMNLALLDIDAERVAKAGATLARDYSVDVFTRRVDVASPDDVNGAASEVSDCFGRCELLWVNVGVQHFGAVEAIDDDVWRWVLDVNVIGAARTVRAFLPLLRAADGGGRIAFTASANALVLAARLGAYQASKYAIVGLAETLRIELASEGIEVSIVYPSGMITRHLESSAAARPADLGPGEVDGDDLQAMMASRPLTAADLTTPEAAAERALAEVLAGETHVITHGDLADAVSQQHEAINRALTRR